MPDFEKTLPQISHRSSKKTNPAPNADVMSLFKTFLETDPEEFLIWQMANVGAVQRRLSEASERCDLERPRYLVLGS